MMKKILCGALALLMSLSLAACAPKEPVAEPTPDDSGETQKIEGPATAESLVVAIGKDENSLTPFTYVSSTGLTVNRLIYDTLFTHNLDNEIVPWMVEDDYTIEDYQIFTFTLLEGQKFHDGTPVTADDIVFSFTYPATQNVASQRKICAEIESIEAVDERTVTIRLSAPDVNFLRSGLAAMRIISKAQYENVEDATTVQEAIGSGPYRLREYKVGEYYVLEAVADYFKGTPKVGTLNMPIMQDANAVQSALLSGELAASTTTIGVEVLETFKSAAGIEVFANAGYSPMLMNINNGIAPLDDPVFRTVLTMAIDVNGIMETLYGGYALVGTKGVIRSDLPYAVDGLEYKYDPGEANALLDEGGYREKNKDGIRLTPDGEPCSFEILVYSGSTIRIRTAELIAEQLKEVGIELTVKVMEMDTVDAYVWPDFEVSKGRNYDFAMWGWGSAINADFLVGLFASDFSVGDDNLCGYVNEEVDRIVNEEFLGATDEEKLYQALAALQEEIADNPGLICFGYADSLQACNVSQYGGFRAGKGANVINPYSFLDVE